MTIFRRIEAFFKGLLIQVFPSLGFKGMIDTQINVYRRLKAKFPDASEKDLLNSLIMNRINAPYSLSTTVEERAHYDTLLQDSNKTLKDVIWAIVEYECLLSRGEELHHKLFEVGAEPSAVAEELEKWIKYLNKRVKEFT
ncbi:MAG: hypothetical protein KJ757_03995 [Planctomycetes bacterium]|nr:hypothetical protein [Planctomycetota bacterium]MBU1517654.1 hypothetical protein [Planctomycetota bacterium]MBU2457888.1 hypothetical protein [Planctomycetota bacterium]MBU2596707.1 hypothetical protein [Planctomycetota bacterium]